VVAIAIVVATLLGWTRLLLVNVLHLEVSSADAFWVALWMICDSSRLVFSESLRGLGHIYGATILGDAGRFFLLACTCVALGATGLATVHTFVEGSALTSLTVAIVAALRAAQLGDHGHRGNLAFAQLLSGTFPIYLTNVFAIIAIQSGVIVVGATLSHSAAALYGTASRVSLLLLLPLSIVSLLISPVIARAIHGRDPSRLEAQIRLLTTGATAVAVAGYLAIFALLPWFLRAFLPTTYRGAFGITLILAVGPLVSTGNGPNGLTLIMAGHGDVAAKVIGVVCFVQLGCMIAASDVFGIYGAAIVSSTAAILQNLILTLCVRRILGVWTPTLFRRQAVAEARARATS
jgi:O-antigen/teichoic acid export membrane protein